MAWTGAFPGFMALRSSQEIRLMVNDGLLVPGAPQRIVLVREPEVSTCRPGH